jgi:AcrR family transcriptional regulator
VETAVHRAVWDALGELGYDRLSMDEVARRAGCSRPALYRRWASKRPMVLDVLQAVIRQTEAARPVRLDDPRKSFVDWMMGFAIFLSGPGRGAILALAQARSSDPELAVALDRLVVDDRLKFYDALRAIWGQDVSDGRLDRAVDALLGAIFFRVVLRGEAITEGEVRMLCEEILAAR